MASGGHPLVTFGDSRIIECVVDDFSKVLRRLVGVGGAQSLSGIDAPMLAETSGDDDTARLARANGAFLLSLCGGHEAEAATKVLEEEARQGFVLEGFLLRLNQWVLAEQQELADRHSSAARKRQAPPPGRTDRTRRLGTRQRKRSCGVSCFRRVRPVWMIRTVPFRV